MNEHQELIDRLRKYALTAAEMRQRYEYRGNDKYPREYPGRQWRHFDAVATDMMSASELISKSLSLHTCGNCEAGSYNGQVELVPPPFLTRTDGRGICVDVCLALEITRLWALGIETTGCCCGHGYLPAYIGVSDGSIQAMKGMGYTVWPNPSRPDAEDSFLPKTRLRATQKEN
jgi:hypothetical protein